MEIKDFCQQVAATHNRLSNLFNQVDGSLPVPSELPLSMFKELGVVMEELQVAMEELQQQNDALIGALDMAAVERKRYENLFQSLRVDSSPLCGVKCRDERVHPQTT